MWSAYDEADLFLITTNSTIANGRLVMGAGIAREARDRFPGLDKAMADILMPWCGHLGSYYLLISREWPARKLGGFQTKTNCQLPANITLIRNATRGLLWWATYHPDKQVHLNFPGIGSGGLSSHVVMPYITQLPDNVTIWQKEN
jgi:hypothetical protein